MKTIKYINFFDNPQLSENRVQTMSAVNKANYVINVLNELDYSVDIISPSWTKNSNGKYLEKKVKIDKNNLTLFKTFGFKNKILSKLSSLYTFIQFEKYLMKKVKDGDVIIFYHYYLYYHVMKKLKKKKDITIILEVEEKYSDVGKNKRWLKLIEERIFSLADRYIFVTKLLERKINTKNKPYCIAHGTYKTDKQKIKQANKKIHIVYSGIIDVIKKGAFVAAELGKFLNDNYVIHIIGFGTENNINKLKEKIKNETFSCKVIYDGLKKGEEYIKYLQKCHIGLSTQDPNAKFNETSFPSKILAYLSNGLRVVSVNIPAIKTSDVGDLLYYYDNNDPKEIADIILNIDVNSNYDSRKHIDKLNKKFKNDMKVMLDDK